MVRDARIGRRNALLIPGWLLIIYSLAAIIYAEGIRNSSDFCDDASRVLINGLCYSVWKLVVPLLLIGIGLAVGGATGLRGQPERLEQRLRPGSPSYVLLALLISFVIVPTTLLAIQLYRQNRSGLTYQVELLGVPYKHIFLLALAVLVALLILVPYVFAWLATERRRRDFLDAVGSEQQPAEPEPPAEIEEREPEPEEEQDEAEAWPDERPEAKHYRLTGQPVIDLEGIGPAYAQRLEAQGIVTTEQLYLASAEDLAAASEISLNLIENWQRMSELTAIKGIGPQYAEALVRAGIDGVDELRKRSASALANQVTAYLSSLENHVLGQAVTEARVKGWKEAAKGLRKL